MSFLDLLQEDAGTDQGNHLPCRHREEGGVGSQEKGWDKELYDKQPDSTGHRSPEFLVRCMRLHEKERWEVKIKSKL